MTVNVCREVNSYRISTRGSSSISISGSDAAPFALEQDSSAAAAAAALSHAGGGAAGAVPRNAICVDFAPDLVPTPNVQAMTVDGRLLVSCGYWDNSFKVLAVDSGRLLQSVCQHRGTVTCVALGRDGRTLVTGARDTTLMVWVLAGAGDRGSSAGAPVLVPPRLTLFGHDDEVSAVAVNCELDVVVSGGNDGAVLLHTLRTGTFVWSASPVGGGRVSAIHISPTNGLVAVYSQARFTLALLNINGRVLVRTTLHDRLSDMLISRDGEHLVTAGYTSVVFRTLHNLKFSHKHPVPVPVNCLSLTPDGAHLLLGMKDGSLLALGRNPACTASAGATASRLLQRISRFTLFPRASASLTASLNTDLSSSAPAHAPQETTSDDAPTSSSSSLSASCSTTTTTSH